jgi:hypothetical protein
MSLTEHWFENGRRPKSWDSAGFAGAAAAVFGENVAFTG